jgi:hypothetical protein
MKIEPKFRLTLSPQEELQLRTTIVAGLLASGQFTFPPEQCEPSDSALEVLRPYELVTPGPDGTQKVVGAMLVSAVAYEILCQLRTDVEQDAEQSPERYTGLAFDQMPTS